MSPAPVARFMAQMFKTFPDDIRVLDAGAGVGSLSAAFVHEVCLNHQNVRSISLTAFEIDPALRRQLHSTLRECAAECTAARIDFRFRVISECYISGSAKNLHSNPGFADSYNCAILNPPYAKINSNSSTHRTLKELGIQTGNLYSAFIAITLFQLAKHGQIVAITPRSFCNGTYFKSFRKLLLGYSSLEHVHVYESRRDVFRDDAVLQESIIYRLSVGRQAKKLLISSSYSPVDVCSIAREIPFDEVVVPDDKHYYIRLPVTEEDRALAQRIRALPKCLGDLGVTVSTGRVVDFKVRSYLRRKPQPGTVPLIYPSHFDGGHISWPNLWGKKANALEDNENTKKLMLPKGAYVLIKRFTSKEEKRRLVAAIYDPDMVGTEKIAFENHLNFFHSGGEGLRPALARGLAVFLNSTAVDQYFRQFSGHTQVNAADLRGLRYPTLTQLEEIGSCMTPRLSSQDAIDDIVSAALF